jgi:crossover junction endodeoxyribonuclease RuvC
MIFVGIDPGAVSGAFGVIDHNAQFIGCGQIPVKDERIDVIGLKSLLLGFIPVVDSAMICIEQVHLMPGQGVSSGAKFMRATGAIEATCQLTNYPVTFVTPQKWKKHFCLIGVEKSKSLEVARQRFTDAPLSLKKHHNLADALLLSLYLLESTT